MSTTSMRIRTRRSISTSGENATEDGAVNARSTLNSALAGWIAGVTGTIVGHPLDSFKVWLQTGSGQGTNRHLSVERSGAIGAARSNIRALYSGISGPLLTVGLTTSINFSIFDGTRRILYRRQHHPHNNHNNSDTNYMRDDSIWNVALAGFTSGSVLALLTAPQFKIKQRQQISGEGFRTALRATLWNVETKKFQLRSCYTAIIPHFISSTLSISVYYAVYEASKRSILARRKDMGTGGSNSLPERIGCGALAGISSWVAIFPFDGLRSRMYNDREGLSTMQMARKMYLERSFFRGLWVTVLRAGPAAATLLPVYDLALERLQARH